jgi:TAP-like protein
VADLGNARLVTARGNGHGTVTSLDPCLVGPVLAYLETGTPPAEGLTCRRPAPFADASRQAALASWAAMVR